MEKTEKISEIVKKLNELLEKYGDLPVFMDVSWEFPLEKIHSINYSTDESGNKFISLIHY